MLINYYVIMLFLIGINYTELDQIGFVTLCRNELWSKIEVPLYIYIYINQKIIVCAGNRCAKSHNVKRTNSDILLRSLP